MQKDDTENWEQKENWEQNERNHVVSFCPIVFVCWKVEQTDVKKTADKTHYVTLDDHSDQIAVV